MKKLIFFFPIILIAFLSYSQITPTSLGVYGAYYDIQGDNNGTIHILWLDNGWAKYGQIVDRGVENQITIPGLARLEVGFNKLKPRISVKPDGTEVHFVFIPFGDDTRFMHVWSNDFNDWSEWNKEEIFDANTVNASGHVVYPAMAVDASGVLHAVTSYWDSTSGFVPIYYFRKAVGGSWVRQANITARDADYYWSDMYTDSSGNVHMTWDKNKKILQYRTAPSGGNLADSTTITLPARTDRNKESDVFVDTAGNVHVAALSYDDPGSVVGIDYWSKPVGGSFSTPVQASLGNFALAAVYHPNPAVIANGLDMVAVAWGDKLSPTKVSVSLYNGTGWTKYVVDNNANFLEETKPSMALNSTTAYLVWRGAEGDILLQTFDFASFGVLSPSGEKSGGLPRLMISGGVLKMQPEM